LRHPSGVQRARAGIAVVALEVAGAASLDYRVTALVIHTCVFGAGVPVVTRIFRRATALNNNVLADVIDAQLGLHTGLRRGAVIQRQAAAGLAGIELESADAELADVLRASVPVGTVGIPLATIRIAGIDLVYAEPIDTRLDRADVAVVTFGRFRTLARGIGIKCALVIEAMADQARFGRLAVDVAETTAIDRFMGTCSVDAEIRRAYVRVVTFGIGRAAIRYRLVHALGVKAHDLDAWFDRFGTGKRGLATVRDREELARMLLADIGRAGVLVVAFRVFEAATENGREHADIVLARTVRAGIGDRAVVVTAAAVGLRDLRAFTKDAHGLLARTEVRKEAGAIPVGRALFLSPVVGGHVVGGVVWKGNVRDIVRGDVETDVGYVCSRDIRFGVDHVCDIPLDFGCCVSRDVGTDRVPAPRVGLVIPASGAGDGEQ